MLSLIMTRYLAIGKIGCVLPNKLTFLCSQSSPLILNSLPLEEGDSSLLVSLFRFFAFLQEARDLSGARM